MPYPEKNASYVRTPRFVEDAKRAEGGGVSFPKPRTLNPEYAYTDRVRKDDQEQEAARSGANFNLRSPEGLAAARQKLDSVGLGNAMTIAPSAEDKE